MYKFTKLLTMEIKIVLRKLAAYVDCFQKKKRDFLY